MGTPRRDTDGRLGRGAITASRGLRRQSPGARGSSWPWTRLLGEAGRLPLALPCMSGLCRQGISCKGLKPIPVLSEGAGQRGGPQEQDSLTEAQPGEPQRAGARSRRQTQAPAGHSQVPLRGTLLHWPLCQRPEPLLALLPIGATASAALGRHRSQVGSRAGSGQWARWTDWVAPGTRGTLPSQASLPLLLSSRGTLAYKG